MSEADVVVYRFRDFGKPGSYRSRRHPDGRWEVEDGNGGWEPPSWFEGNKVGDECVAEGIFIPDDTPQHPLNILARQVHTANKKWWTDLHTGEPIERNVGEMLCLVHSEISEALEGHRKGLKDDKLPHRSQFEVELADAIIRILDIADGMRLDIGAAFEEKMAYNAVRKDHTREGRLAEGGKKY